MPFISGDLFQDKVIKRFVPVERTDHIVSVPRGGRSFIVVGETRGICIANDVQPMSAPLFAVTGIVKQAVDYSCKGLFIRVAVI